MKGLIVAIQFLTRLPTPRLTVSDSEFAASMRWFPAVGVIVGAIVATAAWGGAWIDPWLGALAGVALWVLVTGALHLDGLSDVADACGAAHKDRTRMLATMADPHVGSFAVVTIALQLVAKIVLLHGLIEVRAFVLIASTAFAARIGPLLWSRWLPDLHHGLASRFRAIVRPVDLALWAALLGIAAWISPALLVTPAVLAGWGLWLRAKLGGISGDGHGAGIELTESGLLLTALIMAKLQ